ncbi:MAG: UDP-N-acetylmuramoyl-L-alanyl-D-glutamate--2,6-diaminopimelate ligase [Clostridiaceae bacterium]
MELRKILKGLDFEVIKGNLDVNIGMIQYDSRKVKKGDVFVSFFKLADNGDKYLKDASLNEARVLVSEEIIDVDDDVTFIKVKDARETLAKMSINYYDNPASKLKIIGITGTNGKTTSSYMIKAILEEAGYKTGLIGTIANYISDKKVPSMWTTPESPELHRLLNDMVVAGVEYVIMEVSSHSLCLKRVYGIEFNVGIFTNLTRDHLDFHKTFENYFNSKLMLFNSSKVSLINIDDEYGKKIISNLENVFTYSLQDKGNVNAKDIEINSKGASFNLAYKNEEKKININIPGSYNVYNALASASLAIIEGIPYKSIKGGLSKLSGVSGRCEIVSNKYNLPFDIVLDYAHTPDGLENILKTARDFTKGRLICVFGCGGDRDKIKRPQMGEIASNICNLVIVTSDNPRSEDPNLIIKDIVKGISKENYRIMENRHEAIKMSMKLAHKDDVIVIAGKGHEDYQILKTGKIHFDEHEVVDDLVKELF